MAPVMAMMADLRRRHAEFDLHYWARSPARTAFREDLTPLAAAGRVHFHHDGGDPANGLDIAAALRDRPPGTHLYFCGPASMMAMATEAAGDWPAAMVPSEDFTSSCGLVRDHG